MHGLARIRLYLAYIVYYTDLYALFISQSGPKTDGNRAAFFGPTGPTGSVKKNRYSPFLFVVHGVTTEITTNKNGKKRSGHARLALINTLDYTENY